MKTKSLTSLFAIALALVACNKNETEPAFTPELKLDKTEKITASAEGGSVDLKVTANVSWTATVSDEDVATVSPASKEITDKKSAETPVTVTISENETTEARTATLTLKAEGCKDIVVEIEQAAAEIPDVFEVTDEEGNPIGTDPIELSYLGESSMLYVNSNIDWTATSSDATWLTVEPSTFTAESKEVEPTAVTVTATVNPSTTDGRTGTITFTAEGQTPVVVSYTQKANVPLSVTVLLVSPSVAAGEPDPDYPDHLYNVSAMLNPTAEITECYYFYGLKSEWSKELEDWESYRESIISDVKEYGYEAEQDELKGLNKVEGADPCIWTWRATPATEYIYIAYFVDIYGRDYLAYQINKSADAPEVQLPEDLLGSWICPSQDWTMTLSKGTLGAIIENFDPDLAAIAKRSGLEVQSPDALWDGTENTLTVPFSTKTGLVSSNYYIVWIGLTEVGGYDDIVYNVDLNNYTLTLDGYGYGSTTTGASFFGLYKAPLVFYKEGHVPAGIAKTAKSGTNLVKYSYAKDLAIYSGKGKCGSKIAVKKSIKF